MNTLLNSLEIPVEGKTYWHEPGKIYIHSKDPFGMVITRIVMEGDPDTVSTVWANLRDMFTYRKRQKMREIKNSLGITS